MTKKSLNPVDTLKELIKDAVSFQEEVESCCNTYETLMKNSKSLRKQAEDIIKSLKKEVNVVKANNRKLEKQGK